MSRPDVKLDLENKERKLAYEAYSNPLVYDEAANLLE